MITKRTHLVCGSCLRCEHCIRKDERNRIRKILESYKIDECGADFTPDDAEVNDFIDKLIRKVK